MMANGMNPVTNAAGSIIFSKWPCWRHVRCVRLHIACQRPQFFRSVEAAFNRGKLDWLTSLPMLQRRGLDRNSFL